jgi:predicted transcriptional regulator
MFRQPYHPNAFLTSKRNIHPGLVARTKIIILLETNVATTKTISQKTGLSPSGVLYHLHLLETETILRHKGGRSYVWQLTGVGQQTLKI